jgi:hypothetical protein
MNLYLYQPQYAFKFRGQDQYWLPYSTGSLWAYANQFEDIRSNWQLKELGFRRDSIADVVDNMQDPAVVGFSVYIWNRNYCVKLGEAIKKRWPGCVIMVGGPMVNSGWTKYDWVDAIVMGEGERSFVEILRTVRKGKPVELFYKMERMETLSGVPSPYVTGVFDDIVKNYPQYRWNMVIETNRGCPYACTFCDWGGLTSSKLKKFDMERVQAELDWIPGKGVVSLFIADANLGIFFERDKEIAKMVRMAADKSGIEHISTNYTKHSDERVIEIATILGIVNKGITLSMQSMNPDTLRAIKRHNLKTNDAKHLFELCTKKNITFYTDLMLGLPLETKDTWIKGITDLLELGQHNQILIIPTNPLENTDLGDRQMSQYGIETVEVVDGWLHTEHDEEAPETWPWVCATNTMPRHDLIDSWLYGWMISNIHMLVGYSRLLSKYCRHVLGVSYREFYDEMWAQLNDEKGDSVVHQQYRIVKKAAQEIFTQGRTTSDDIGADNFLHYCAVFLYMQFDQTHDFCESVAARFGNIDPGVIELQKRYVQNNFYSTPITVETQVDIDTWEQVPCVYEVHKQHDVFEVTYDNFWSLQQRQRKLQTNMVRVN